VAATALGEAICPFPLDFGAALQSATLECMAGKFVISALTAAAAATPDRDPKNHFSQLN
jgi:hypothetical protein